MLYQIVCKESGKVLFLMASLIQLVKSKKQFSQIFSMFTGISPAVPLSESKFFKTFLTVVSENTGKRIFGLA